jgi:pyruvate dehydrogenase complex dehydrogenase (E1) component
VRGRPRERQTARIPDVPRIKYLLGDLDRSYLTTLRARGGLQSYPSRIKDPDDVDFSTGSVGLGAAAPLFAARGWEPSRFFALYHATCPLYCR